MKSLILATAALAATGLASPAGAEGHLDVIAFTLNEGCTLEEHLQTTAEFNSWGESYGYQARILVPVQSDDLETYFWIGESADAATFGGAWDAWRTGVGQPDSEPAKLWARFLACSTNVRRTGYDIYL